MTQPTGNDPILSKTITFLRFPMIVAVIFIHTNLGGVVINGTQLAQAGQYRTYALLHHAITDEVARIAVPLFFFISGFLFFYRSDFSLKTYGRKLKKRIRTLLIPYLFWNLAVLLLTFMSQLLLPSMLSGNNQMVADYGCLDWLDLFWSHTDGTMPICYPLWFIRDLMIVVLFTPAIHFLIRHVKTPFIIALGLLWLSGLCPEVPGLSITAFFFFSLGAWFSINKIDFTAYFRPASTASAVAYLALAALATCLWHFEVPGYLYVHNLGIAVGLVAVVSLAARGVERGRLRVSPLLAGSAFLVYAYHGMPLALASKLWVKAFSPINELTLSIGYLLLPFLIAALGVCIYALAHKYLPTMTSIATGGR